MIFAWNAAPAHTYFGFAFDWGGGSSAAAVLVTHYNNAAQFNSSVALIQGGL